MRLAAGTGILAVLVVASIVAAPSASARYEGNVNLFVGQKWLKEGDWAPVDQQPEIGIRFAFAPERAPIYFAIDATASRETQTVTSPLYGTGEAKGSTQEYSVGVRKVWNGHATRPFVGAGGCLVNSNLDFDYPGVSQQSGDSSYGVWIESGITWRLGEHVNLGFDLRYSTATASFENLGQPIDVEAGGFHAGVLIGYGW